MCSTCRVSRMRGLPDVRESLLLGRPKSAIAVFYDDVVGVKAALADSRRNPT